MMVRGKLHWSMERAAYYSQKDIMTVIKGGERKERGDER
jgi:hypothetical protein